MTNATALSDNAITPAPDVAREFDPIVSRNLDLLAAADGHLRQAWRALTPVAHRSVVASGCILEIGAMLGDLASERRQLEEAAGI